jgi:hypothetical protein
LLEEQKELVARAAVTTVVVATVGVDSLVADYMAVETWAAELVMGEMAGAREVE